MERTTAVTEQQRYWLALAGITGIGAQTAEQLIQLAGSLEALFTSSSEQLVAAGIPAKVAAALTRPDWHSVDKACVWLQAAADRTLLTLDSPAYPYYLRQTTAAPLLLFVQGSVDYLNTPQLGLVGSRNPSADGCGLARDFAGQLSHAGLTITSGMALGIDAAAHDGALAADGLTVAVYGCGPDRTYPKKHAELAERIRAQGALVSEFFPGTPPLATNFPRRNRIISGLSVGVLVVEAALRSGSLITARYANEEGREVFAIPGSIHVPQARGCHYLIRQGAKLVESVRDILEELVPLFNPSIENSVPAEDERQFPAPADLSAEALHLLELIGVAPTSVDNLVAQSGLTADAVSSILLLLELRGLVASQPGGTYSRLRRDNT